MSQSGEWVEMGTRLEELEIPVSLELLEWTTGKKGFPSTTLPLPCMRVTPSSWPWHTMTTNSWRNCGYTIRTSLTHPSFCIRPGRPFSLPRCSRCPTTNCGPAG